MQFVIREIQPQDDQCLAAIIRQVLAEYGANCSGFAWDDPELDYLSTAFAGDRTAYFVVTVAGAIAGGAGFAPFPCEYPQICELQKMYLLPAYRRHGIGTALMEHVITHAQAEGYEGCYLETFDGMKEAISLYEKMGFQPLDKPLGHSGHSSCNRYYCRPFHPQKRY